MFSYRQGLRGAQSFREFTSAQCMLKITTTVPSLGFILISSPIVKAQDAYSVAHCFARDTSPGCQILCGTGPSPLTYLVCIVSGMYPGSSACTWRTARADSKPWTNPMQVWHAPQPSLAYVVALPTACVSSVRHRHAAVDLDKRCIELVHAHPTIDMHPPPEKSTVLHVAHNQPSN